MAGESIKYRIQELIKPLGIKINGDRPWDIKVKNNEFHAKVLAGGSIALGETYMDGWWECKAIDQFIARLLHAELDRKVRDTKALFFEAIKGKLMNLQAKSRAFIVGRRHYDLGNDLYASMLDKRLIYSCGYWKNAKTLDQAQEDKLGLIAQKLKLKPGMTVLDIGCGWGGLAKFFAEKCQVKVLGITVSKEQLNLAKEACKGLDVEIRLQDYRNLNEKFDRIVSVGMFEHVGNKNYRSFFKIANRCLKDDGLFLLHTIGANKEDSYMIDPWLNKYIFPNAILPLASQITKSMENIFKIEDWHNFGKYYDNTLMAWHENFNRNWDKIKDNYDARFKRMWNYYLLSCAASFRAGNDGLWQIVLSKRGSDQDYQSIRQTLKPGINYRHH